MKLNVIAGDVIRDAVPVGVAKRPERVASIP